MKTAAPVIERDISAGIRVSITHLATGAADRAVVVGDRLSKSGFDVTTTASLAAASDRLAERASLSAAIAVVDLSDERQGMSAIRTLRARFASLAIVAVTDPSRPLLAAEALQAGASDVLSWPFHSAEIAGLVSNVADAAGAMSPALELERVDCVIAQSAAMRQVADLARTAGESDSAVFCAGEPGSGRETVARAVHSSSRRASGPFVVVNGAEGQPDELEQRLFGSIDRSAASRSGAPERLGSGSALARARGGTLLVKDVAALPARVQAKLARIIRDGEVLVGEDLGPLELDVRVSATGDDSVDAALADGHLRRDLHDRIAHTRIAVPPLRRRREDIPALAALMLRDLCRALGSTGQHFSRAALTLLSALPFPGNGRDLRALVETLVQAVDRPVIQIDDVLSHARVDGGASRVDGAGRLRDARTRFERDWISAALMKHQGRVEDAAKTLGIQRTNLYRKIRQLNVARALLVRKS